MARIGVFLVLILLISVASAQQQPRDYPGEVFALASAAVGKHIPNTAAAPGFCLGVAWKPRDTDKKGLHDPYLVAEFGRHVSDTHASFNTYLFGAGSHTGERHRLSGFFQVLVGAEEKNLPLDWNYVLAPGGGADLRLNDKISWRAIQVDLTITHGPGTARVSSGFVFRFGHS